MLGALRSIELCVAEGACVTCRAFDEARPLLIVASPWTLRQTPHVRVRTTYWEHDDEQTNFNEDGALHHDPGRRDRARRLLGGCVERAREGRRGAGTAAGARAKAAPRSAVPHAEARPHRHRRS